MLAFALTASGAIYLFAALLVLAPHTAAYSHLRQTISEIGERGARHQRFVAFGLFLPIGLLMLAVSALTRGSSSAVAALALCIAVGYIGAALFPCDPGSPVSGSAQQAMHNLAGAVEYIGGGIALTIIAREFGELFKVAGFFVLAGAVGLSLIPPRAGRGLLQRAAELCLFGGLSLAAWQLGPVH